MCETINVRERIEQALGIGADESVIAAYSDEYRCELAVDLEELQGGNLSEAFIFSRDLHDTVRWVGQREYNGIIISAVLPDAFTTSSLISFCEDIWNRRDELTSGFSVQWDGGNWSAHWLCDEDEDEGDEESEGNDETAWEAAQAAQTFWENFGDTTLEEVDAVEVYDLADCDNISFVRQTLEEYYPDVDLTQADAVRRVLDAHYASDLDTAYRRHTVAAHRIAQAAQEEAEEGDNE